LRPGFARTRGEAYSAFPELLAGFKTRDKDKRRRKGKRQEGIDSLGRGTEEGRKGRQGKRDGRE